MINHRTCRIIAIIIMAIITMAMKIATTTITITITTTAIIIIATAIATIASTASVTGDGKESRSVLPGKGICASAMRAEIPAAPTEMEGINLV